MADTADTIVAVSTPPGRGGVGIVRVSGPDAEAIAVAIVGQLPEPRRATLKTFRDASGRTIDQGIAIYYPAPGSFTGESVIEMQGHGGDTVMGMLVDAAIRAGARRAAPGEFSKRAFLNDKLDLVQAEAIVDIINGGTAQAVRAAQRSLSGEFSRAARELTDAVTELRVYVEAAIDFPEEELDFLGDAELAERVGGCQSRFAALLEAARAGRVLRDGFRVVLVGQPNAGKSSLMNRLSGEETAIVTEVAGTTRDILKEQINIDGLLVELVDTAGLREDPGVVEKEGIRRARNAMANADAVLWVRDATDPGKAAKATIDESLPAGVPVVIVMNKSDLVDAVPPGDDAIAVSAKTGAGLDALRAQIAGLAGYNNLGEGALTARRRHIEALETALRHFEAGRAALDESRAGELFAEELRLAQNALCEITGDMSSDELLGRIFSQFCIGK